MAADVATEPRLLRFGATERWLHWVHAAAFTAMLATGLVLYLPFLSQVVSARPLMKAVHLVAAVGWLVALAVVPLLGDRRALRRTRRELERFDADDLRWLRPRGADRSLIPQGRFNAGQKAHSVLQAALSVLFVVSGVLLWLGERNTSLRFAGTLPLHDAAMALAGIFVLGHVFMALSPEHRASMEGATRGTVPASYAAHYHAKWNPPPAPATSGARFTAARPGRVRVVLALALVAAGLAGSTLLVRDVFHGDDPLPAPATPAVVKASPLLAPLDPAAR
jgi:formate dehydrogenase subunit gamma